MNRGKRSNRRFPRGHNHARVVRELGDESNLHVPIRVVHGRVSYSRDLVAKLGGIANGRVTAGMCDESDDDELVDAVLLER